MLHEGNILITGTVDEVRSCDDERVQNMLNRRARVEELDTEAYLKRLTH
jgi:ABC-type transporter Mla maintaining outer membrane lipid asymmetry ATPase subunit MlaF